jgi:hypothetical protein
VASNKPDREWSDACIGTGLQRRVVSFRAVAFGGTGKRATTRQNDPLYIVACVSTSFTHTLDLE